MSAFFFLVSKLLYFLTKPLFWIALGLFIAIGQKKQVGLRRWLKITLGLLFFFGNGFVSTSLLGFWEIAPTPIANLTKPQYEVAIILGGFTELEQKPNDRVYVNRAVERLLTTVQLYKQGRIQKIVATGGSGMLMKTSTTEAESIKSLLLTCGVAEQDIWVEAESKNTYDNAILTKVLLKQQGIETKEPMLLVTSAFHMRRAEAVFQKAGYNTTSFSVDVRSGHVHWFPPFFLIPSVEALGKWDLLIHEWVGCLSYWFMGYL